MSRAQRKTFWDNEWKQRNDLNVGYSSIAMLFERSIDLKSLRFKSVLEIGCQNMIYSPLFLSNGISYVGIDISFGSVKNGKSLLESTLGMQTLTNNSSLAVADALELPFKSDSFDFVFGLQTFYLFGEGILDPIMEAKRVLRSGGTLQFDVFHTDYSDVSGSAVKFGTSHPIKGLDILSCREQNIGDIIRTADMELLGANVLRNSERPMDMHQRYCYMDTDDTKFSIIVKAMKR